MGTSLQPNPGVDPDHPGRCSVRTVVDILIARLRGVLPVVSLLAAALVEAAGRRWS